MNVGSVDMAEVEFAFSGEDEIDGAKERLRINQISGRGVKHTRHQIRMTVVNNAA